MLDLNFGLCKFCVASTEDYNPNDHKRKRIATKYPTIATDYFNQKGEDVEIISIQGSVEIAPCYYLADAIVDIVETGSTLVANGLKVYEDICRISARMIVNKASLKIIRKSCNSFVRLNHLLETRRYRSNETINWN